MDNRYQELKSYLMGFDRPALIRRLEIYSGVFAALWVAFTLILWLIDGRNIVPQMLLIGVAGCILFNLINLLTGVVIPWMRLKPSLKKVERESRMNDLLFDFETADLCWDGKLRLGQWWIFCEGSGRLVAYDEIICCTKEGRMAKSRGNWLAVLLDSEKLFCLCEIPVNAKDVDEILAVMKERNEDIEILQPAGEE